MWYCHVLLAGHVKPANSLWLRIASCPFHSSAGQSLQSVLAAFWSQLNLGDSQGIWKLTDHAPKGIFWKRWVDDSPFSQGGSHVIVPEKGVGFTGRLFLIIINWSSFLLCRISNLPRMTQSWTPLAWEKEPSTALQSSSTMLRPWSCGGACLKRIQVVASKDGWMALGVCMWLFE